jgi:hypothetical protein
MEKPFGNDLPSAARLDDFLHAVFAESKIFRIDHFAGKEAAWNILAFRFATGPVRAHLREEKNKVFRSMLPINPARRRPRPWPRACGSSRSPSTRRRGRCSRRIRASAGRARTTSR